MDRAPLALVVDDEPAITRLIALGLRHVGFRVEVAGSVAEGLARFEALRDDLDLLVLDRDLPDGTGDDLLRAVREGWDGPVLLQSAWPAHVPTVDARTQHLPKPWSLRDFVETAQHMVHPEA